MLQLKAINLEDCNKEYEALMKFPQDENGFENKYYGVSKEEFTNKVIPELINHSRGIDVPDGRVPETYYFLWDNEKIVGLFKLRHCLNDFLRKGAGHVGYGILPEYRGKGYATEGLKLLIAEAAKIIEEDEIYLSAHKDNLASLKVQQKCGARIVGESENGKEILTRIKF